MRFSYKYPKDDSFAINKLISYTEKLNYSSVLISNTNTEEKYSSYTTIIALGAIEVLKSENNSFNKLRKFHLEHKDWLFGFFAYDLKNEIEELSSNGIDELNIPNLLFYIPETVLLISKKEVLIESVLSKKEVDEFIEEIRSLDVSDSSADSVFLKFREEKKEYLEKIRHIKSHIQKGDIYEMNYCQELYNDSEAINPREVFLKLNNLSKAPFAVFFNYEENYLLCSSPERFLKKEGSKIISQPIKGTRKRGKNIEEDKKLIDDLQNSKKDRSENVMITDLVRNDLSRTAKKASVHVEELFGIYTFNQVHHMMSTITSELDNQYDFIDVLESSFPMGSMTGAPKIKAMELIEKYETTKRSLFSSAFGYIRPNSDFDFNVVIRSILYNEIKQYTSVMVGGAITINSDEIEEYEECLVKAKAMIKVLRNEK